MKTTQQVRDVAVFRLVKYRAERAAKVQCWTKAPCLFGSPCQTRAAVVQMKLQN